MPIDAHEAEIERLKTVIERLKTMIETLKQVVKDREIQITALKKAKYPSTR